MNKKLKKKKKKQSTTKKKKTQPKNKFYQIIGIMSLLDENMN